MPPYRLDNSNVAVLIVDILYHGSRQGEVTANDHSGFVECGYDSKIFSISFACYPVLPPSQTHSLHCNTINTCVK